MQCAERATSGDCQRRSINDTLTSDVLPRTRREFDLNARTFPRGRSPPSAVIKLRPDKRASSVTSPQVCQRLRGIRCEAYALKSRTRLSRTSRIYIRSTARARARACTLRVNYCIRAEDRGAARSEPAINRRRASLSSSSSGITPRNLISTRVDTSRSITFVRRTLSFEDRLELV